jgi:deoxycytidine triphosphate deaminase
MSTPDPNPPNTQADGFAQSDEDAAKKAKQHGERDPLPDVDPALLNSSDVIEYIRLTGMVYPFDSSEKAQLDLFKTASYEGPLVGEMHWIDEDRNHQRVTLDPRSDSKSCRSFTLKKNQIAFFSPTVTFRLPLYIAMRFNLHISHVHKGLLLGTGPIVDPGFEGRLLIPLHNLTAHDYDLQAGQGAITESGVRV